MKYTSLLKVSKRSLNESLEKLVSDGFKTHVIFVADPTSQLLPITYSVISSFQETMYAVAFPGIVAKGIHYNKGIVILSFRQHCSSEVVDLNSNYSLDTLAQKLPEDANALLVLYDALSTGKRKLQEQLYFSMGTDYQIFGGGAGHRDFRKTPTVVAQDGMHEQSALIIGLNVNVEIDFAVGWDPIYGPMKVTGSKGNDLLEIEWKPAYEFYKEMVESHARQTMLDGSFFELACRYPFGMGRMQDHYVVRDALSADTDKNSIQLVDEVPEGEYVSVLNGDRNTLDREIRSLNVRANQNWQVRNSFFTVHCISRSIFLGDDFQQELDNLSKGFDVYGVLSIGELASRGTSIPEILNKSVVAVCLST